MAAKNSKLAAQFEADASTSAAEVAGGVFAGVSIFVDGFTVPSSQELKEIMLNNGGRFVNYFSRNTVTHIICTHLPNSKMSNLRAFSKGLPVVKPAWVVDSLAENRLLNCAPYQISQHSSSSRKQTKLSAFFSGSHYQGELNDQNKRHELHSSSAQEGSQDQNSGCDKEGSLLKEEASNDSLSSNDHKASMFEEQDSEDFVDEDGNACETECSERTDNGVDGKFDIAQSPDVRSRCSNLCSTSSMDSRLSLDSMDRNATRSSSRTHSTLTDPNFVENYFKYSRLHFIGTWRNRYRKRFSNLLGAKSSKGNGDHSGNRTIIHIDMDCFFVSVVIRNKPELHDKPVAVCHSDNPKGTAEISSANYPARNYGIKAGMFVRDAKARCPHLMVVPYDFDAYGEVADQFYGILHKYCSKVQALSCDEAFLDMTECLHDNPEEVTEKIRNEIFGTTKCSASAGIAGNMLLARLATRSAKPNGQCFISSEKVVDYLNTLSIKALPGIGHTVSDKLKSREVEYCGQLRNIPKEALYKDFGKKIGDTLWNYCRGIDHSVVEAVQETKSVGAEVNWGVRFNTNKDAENFLANLSKEVCLRLEGCGVQGRTITLKLKTRRKGAGEPIKFMGCGDCETVSRSMTIAGATDSLVTLQRIAKQLFASFRVDVKEVRGVGLKISRLEHADLAQGAPRGNMLESWLVSPSEMLKKHSSEKACLLKSGDDAAMSEQQGLGSIRGSSIGGTSHLSEVNLTSDRPTRVHGVELPPLPELDLEVLKNLPPEIISEMNDMYKGELHGFLGITSGDKAKENDIKSPAFQAVTQNLVPVLDAKLHGDGGHKDPIHFKKETEIKGFSGEQLSGVNDSSASCSRASELVDIPRESAIQHDFMPNSLSQADVTVLQELPEDVKADLFNTLPLHRSGVPTCSTSTVAENEFPENEKGNDPKQREICLPPRNSEKWIEEFRVSSCLRLEVIAKQYTDSISSQPLSSVLEYVVPYLHLCPDSGSEEWNVTLAHLSEFLKQYIHLKVASDIEELHKCFRLLKRLSSASELFLELHDSILPLLQDSVSQHYGGILHF
uniref:DNA repair protein REV1 n=2 Tax=Oryza brachyantha TaxID=4533 RepID=J3MH33_ORYBR